jgi:hypothetical protein
MPSLSSFVRASSVCSRVGASALRVRLVVVALVGVAAVASTGCGNTIYAVSVNSAASKVEEAESLGAEQYAPYEYYSAKLRLEKARTEAAEADYGDAIDLADESEKFADKAIRLAREAHRGAGR